MASENITNPLVSVEFLPDHTPVISSRDMALHFQKKHKHILEEIKRIQSITPKSFHEPNFRPMSIDVEIGNGAIRKDPAYLLTRDAFSLLAMGFTGKAAIQWKLRYIEAFNALEKAVLEQTRQTALLQGVETALSLSANEKLLLQKVVRYRQRGFTQTEIAKVTEAHRIQIGHLLAKAKKLGLLPDAPQKPGKRKGILAVAGGDA